MTTNNNTSDAERFPSHIPGSTFMNLPYTADLQRKNIKLVVAGVPWDGGTISPAGSRLGPSAIRQRSKRIRHYHPVFGFSPFELCPTVDVGDVLVNDQDQSASLASIEKFFSHIAQHNIIPVTAGGDHLITLPILRAIAGDGPVGLIHVDAHGDTADTSSQGNKFSSSTPFRRAVEEGLVNPERVIQIGIRGPTRIPDKERWARDAGMRVITMDEFHDMGITNTITETHTIAGDGPVYITVDIDGIDPAFAPGTGTPVVGGLTSYEILRILRSLRGLNIVGGDVTEVCPHLDINDMTALLAGSLMFEILCLAAEGTTQ